MPTTASRLRRRGQLAAPSLALPLLALAAACGARSALTPGETAQEGTGGAGGATAAATTTTSASVTSSTGQGGGPVTSCPYLGVTGQPISYTSAAALHGARPELVRVSASQTMVLFARQDMNDPSAPQTIGHVTFEPWGDWPQSLGSVLKASSIGGEGFAAAPGAAEPSAAVMFFLPTGAFPSDMFLAPTVKANEYYEPYPEGTSWDAWEPAWATALARGQGGHLAAFQLGFAPGSFLRLADVQDGLPATTTFDVACANMPFPADLTPVANGYLLASANGRAFGSCDDDDGIPGPATRLDVMFVEPKAGAIPLSVSFEGVDPLAHVALARRPGGAWLAWQENGASAFTPPPVQAIALDDAGNPVGPRFQLTSDGETSGPIAITDLGGQLAAVWVDSVDPSSPSLRIGVFDAGGTTVAIAGYQLLESFLFEPSLSLAASDDGKQLLLSWAALGPAGPAMVEVLRLSCLDGPPPP